MRKKYIYCAVILVMLIMSMTACGSGEEGAVIVTQESEPESKELAQEPVPEQVLSETEKAILDYELQYRKGDFSLRDYQALAALYQEQGLIRKQRDMLEQSYRLYDDQQAFDMLQTISVNLEEEDESVQIQGNLMLQNLELEEYLNESVNLIGTEEWFHAMMPKLDEGSRSYFLQRNGETVLFIQAGYDQQGVPYSNVWYMGERAKVLRHSENAIQLLTTQLADGAYQGTFESWMCDGSTGDITHETGTFTKGVLTGDYTAAIHTGTEASDLFSLWSNREGMEYTTYTGNFNEHGITTLEQPADKKIKSLIKNTDYSTCVVYAYDENKRNCLFEGLTEDAETTVYTFGIELMGWKHLPAFDVYDVKEESEETESVTDIKVRVFDGELQLYLDDTWVNMGAVEQYVKEDPFLAYEDKIQNVVSGGSETDAEADSSGESKQNPFGQKRTEGAIPKDVVKPATQKPATKPAPEQAPQETPQQQEPQQQQPQQQAPTIPPTNDNNGSNNNDSNNSNGGNSSNNNDNGGSGSDSGDSGNDVDVEWTPDIL